MVRAKTKRIKTETYFVFAFNKCLIHLSTCFIRISFSNLLSLYVLFDVNLTNVRRLVNYTTISTKQAWFFNSNFYWLKNVWKVICEVNQLADAKFERQLEQQHQKTEIWLTWCRYRRQYFLSFYWIFDSWLCWKFDKWWLCKEHRTGFCGCL